VTLSLDDIYLDHANQVALAQAHPSNPLLQHRGQPSTHDLALGEEVFASLAAERPTAIPQYDKSAFEGQGDRVPKAEWKTVNEKGQDKVKVVILKGGVSGSVRGMTKPSVRNGRPLCIKRRAANMMDD
jgi:Predicted kinase